MRVPLAWNNLTHDRRRLLLAVGGVGFAVLLMFLQLGFRNALLDSTVAFLESLDADLIVTSPSRYALAVSEPFPRRRLEQARGCPDVIAAEPLYLEGNLVTLRGGEDAVGITAAALDAEAEPTSIDRPIRVAAFDPGASLFLDSDIRESATRLSMPMTVLADDRSKRDYGPLTTGKKIELAGRRVEIVGTFALGTDFANDGTLLTSIETLHALVPRRHANAAGAGNVDLGIIRLRPGSDAEDVRTRLAALLPSDVVVRSKAGYVAEELRFWKKSTPIGFVFGLGLALGFVVGVVVCYQILATEISDHMAELATLKAMGYSPRFFLFFVLEESLYLAVLGFIPGVLGAAICYAGIASATGLLMRLSANRACAVFLLTLAMCVVSGLLAIRRLHTAQPADLFT
jgi:putative ABC transport system permease protein